MVVKPELYAQLGVHEYFMHDPTSDYLDPPLQGFRLCQGNYEPIPLEPSGGLYSEELELELRISEGELNLFHRGTDDRLLTNFGTVRKESAARKQAEAEVAKLQAELAALKRKQK